MKGSQWWEKGKKKQIFKKEDAVNQDERHGLEEGKYIWWKFTTDEGESSRKMIRGRGDKTQVDWEQKSEVVRARVWPSAYRK